MTVSKPPVPWGVAVRLSVEDIQPNPWNPNHMTDEELDKEAASFERFGYVNPIVVRHVDDGLYQIIDGEQRWKTARRLGMEQLDAYDISPLGDHEAQQLTYILNELRGQPQEDKLADLLKGLLAKSTIEDLVAVMPLSKEGFAKAAKLPDFDWGQVEAITRQQPRGFVEMILRIPPEAAETINRAITVMRESEGDMPNWRVFELLAAGYLADR